jgi:hypothetical protein
MGHQETINDSTQIDGNHEDEFMILSRRSTQLLQEGRTRAAMARPVSEYDAIKVIKDSFRNIEQTIQHSVGLEGLIEKKYPKDHRCPSCMIGKSALENYPGSKEPDPRPMALVHMDVYSSLATSIE